MMMWTDLLQFFKLHIAAEEELFEIRGMVLKKYFFKKAFLNWHFHSLSDPRGYFPGGGEVPVCFPTQRKY